VENWGVLGGRGDMFWIFFLIMYWVIWKNAGIISSESKLLNFLN
jgi:hypothetical protein